MYLDINNIDFSKRDLLRRIILPNRLTPELAELSGIIVGDGHIYYGDKYKQTTMYSIFISGSLSEDYDYYKESIDNLFYKLFNLRFSFTSQRKDELIVRVYSKAIINFFKELGIKTGNKTNENYIPSKILKSNDNVKKAFLRGIFDTESSITFKKDYYGKHSKPIISIKMKSLNLILQLKELLEGFNFNVCMYKEEYIDKRSKKLNTGYRVEIVGKKNLKKYLDLIGFRNPRHLTKVKIWKRFSFYPPRVSYKQRIDILNGTLDPNSFYNK